VRNARTTTAEKPEAPAWPACPLGIRVAISEACGCIMMRGDYTRAAGICPRTTALAAFANTYNAIAMRRGRQRQCRWKIGGAQGLLWDLQCKLRVGVIWGRRHLRVALEIY